MGILSSRGKYPDWLRTATSLELARDVTAESLLDTGSKPAPGVSLPKTGEDRMTKPAAG